MTFSSTRAANAWLMTAVQLSALVPGVPRGRTFWRACLERLNAALVMGELLVVLPDGTRATLKGAERGPKATLVFRHWRGLRRLLAGGTTGFAEGYLEGDWETPDIRAFLDLAARNLPHVMAQVRAAGLLSGMNRLRHRLRANTRKGSKRNIAYHYDLGNDFYSHWLDPSMTYSSGLYASGGETLEEAQAAKFERIAEKLDIKPGMRVLEIGCGWGSLACYLAERFGCQVTGVTLSREQLAHGRAQVADRGIEGRVDLRLQDYRDVAGTYDRLVSVEMLEAVGEAYWPDYFEAVRERLTPAGRAVLQVITIDAPRYQTYREGCDFIQRYIFPGGMLPTPEHVTDMSRRHGLEVADAFFFGPSYAETVAEWHRRFLNAWPELSALSDGERFDERFRRMWTYYLAYCEAGFRTGAIDVGQFVLTRD